MTWKKYLINLLNAAVSGGATLLFSNGFGVSFMVSLKIAGSAAAVSAIKWYLQHQPPGTEGS